MATAEQQTSDEESNDQPKPTSVLYCLPRQEATEERVAEIQSALRDAGFDLLENQGRDGENYKIVIPPEEQESGEESDSSTEPDDGADDGEDTEDDESESSEEVEAAESLEDETYDNLYTMAQRREIPDRSDMNKAELIEAIRDYDG